MSEQNLNDMSNALENAVYIENGKLYDNDNNLIDVANTKIIPGSYVGNGTSTISIQIPENQYFFVMLSDGDGNPGNFVAIGELDSHVAATRGFTEQINYASNDGVLYYTYYNSYNQTYSYIQRNSNGQNGTLTFEIGSNYTSSPKKYNLSGRTYHYVTIGV